MFNLFKRKNIEGWEKDVLIRVLSKLPSEYEIFIDQINNDLIKGVLIGLSDIPNYVGFTFNNKIYTKYYKSKERNFKISKIKIGDSLSGTSVNLSIYFSYGLVNGYSIDNHKTKCKLLTTQIDIENIEKIYLDDIEYNKISYMFSNKEREVVNPSDVFSVELEDTTYYHLRDIEDGDFIGIDLKNNIYRITHDPYEINLLDRNLLFELLK